MVIQSHTFGVFCVAHRKCHCMYAQKPYLEKLTFVWHLQATKYQSLLSSCWSRDHFEGRLSTWTAGFGLVSSNSCILPRRGVKDKAHGLVVLSGSCSSRRSQEFESGDRNWIPGYVVLWGALFGNDRGNNSWINPPSSPSQHGFENLQ